MIFNSLAFVEFALLFFLLWPLARRTRGRYVFLIGASCLFYAYAGWWFVPLLLATATLDFVLAGEIVRRPARKRLDLALSLVSNLGALGFFKYSGFAVENAQGLALRLGLPLPPPIAHVVLPLGISFYTFQSLSYVFDVYRGKLEPAKHPLHFLSIVTLFPHLVAGPIVRVSHVLPQIIQLRKPNAHDAWEGLQLVSFGLFKKMVVADRLSPVVDSVYGSAEPMGGGAYWLATFAFAFQIYYDFSGYTDVARGLARWIGLDFEINFNHPYASSSLGEFWTRWHISLSSWVRDYIFIPLGGSRTTEAKVYRNIAIAWLLSGLWHGANWTFVAWGAMNAAGLMVERATRLPTRLGRGPGLALTFGFVLLSWVFFRAADLGQAFSIFASMARGGGGFGKLQGADRLFQEALAFGVLYEGYQAARRLWPKIEIRRVSDPLLVLRTAAMLSACAFYAGPGKAFIYFQF